MLVSNEMQLCSYLVENITNQFELLICVFFLFIFSVYMYVSNAIKDSKIVKNENEKKKQKKWFRWEAVMTIDNKAAHVQIHFFI